MEMNDNHLKPNNMILEGFSAHKVKGTVKIKVTLGFNACTREEEIEFYVVDIDFPDSCSFQTNHFYFASAGKIYDQEWGGIH